MFLAKVLQRNLGIHFEGKQLRRSVSSHFDESIANLLREAV
jgi:hypothetical protein